LKRLRIKRMQVMISAVLLIGIMFGFVLAEMLSTELAFTVEVKDQGPLKLSFVITPEFDENPGISKNQWYNKSIRIDVYNQHPQNTILFDLMILVNASTSDLGNVDGVNEVNMSGRFRHQDPTPFPAWTGIANQTVGFSIDTGTDDGGDDFLGSLDNSSSGISIVPAETLRFQIFLIVGWNAPTGNYEFVFWADEYP
jgi:hypothetical protein